ncbi:hypothetical protein KEM52_003172 [Ascosphaera acerosa]|nr:hypothetical protein KEM52_003172 [Ascosphaera acerosa]
MARPAPLTRHPMSPSSLMKLRPFLCAHSHPNANAEFQDFLRETERELRKLFDSIDRHRNGHLDKTELRKAFAAAGMKVDRIKLDQFFEQLDTDHDGVITFEEWRDFLLFLPAHHSDLYSVLNYFNATGTLDAEGDTTLHRLASKYLQAFIVLLAGFQEPLFLSPRLRLWMHLQLPGGHGAPQQQQSPPLQASSPSHREMPQAHHHHHQQDWPSTHAAYHTSSRAEGSQPSTTPPEQHAHHTLLQHLTPDLDSLDFDLDCAELVLLGLQQLPIPTLTPPPWLTDTCNSIQSLHQSLTLTACSPHLGYFVAGGLAGAISRTATAPLDRLKVYLIAQTGVQRSGPCLDGIAQPGFARRAVQPFVAAVRELLRAGGWKSLFAGNGLNVVKVMPESAIKFGAYEATKRALARVEGHDDPKKLQAGSQFLAGGVGGMVAQSSIYPLDTLKFRMQCETVEGGLHGNRLIFATFRNMWSAGGLQSFYRGLPLGLVGVFPYAAIDFFTFETLKRTMMAAQAKQFHIKEQDVVLSNFTTGAIGAFSGALGASVVYPMNVLRTRLQAQGTVLHRMTYSGIGDVARKTYSAEGTAGFFKGLTPNLMKVIPAVSISYVVYENSKRLLKLA